MKKLKSFQFLSLGLILINLSFSLLANELGFNCHGEDCINACLGEEYEFQITFSEDAGIEYFSPNKADPRGAPLVGLTALEQNCRKLFSKSLFQEGGLIIKCTSANKCSKKEIKKIAAQCKGLDVFGGGQEPPEFYPLSGSLQIMQGKNSGASSGQQGGNQTSQIGRGTGCQGTSYSYDYTKCKTAVGIYNGLAMAEKAAGFFIQQSLSKTQREIADRARENAQDTVATYQAEIENLEAIVKANEKALLMYSGQIGYLSSEIASWPTSKNIHKKYCRQEDNKTQSCCTALQEKYGEEMAYNSALRGQLLGVVTTAGAKALDIKLNNDKLRARIAQLKEQRDGLEKAVSENELLLEYCQSAEGMRDQEKCGTLNQGLASSGLSGGQGWGNNADWSTSLVEVGQSGNAIADFKPDQNSLGTDQSSTRDGSLDFSSKPDGTEFIDNPRGASLESSGGAGGGGSAGGGVGGGGGGSSLSQKPKQPSEEQLEALSKVETQGAYGGSKGGGYYRKAKRSRRRTRHTDDGRKRGLGDLDFKNKFKYADSPVGDSHLALFDLISQRYEKVDGEGRIKK